MKVGFSELIVIFVVAMIFIGPDKMPAYARKAGKWLAKLRDYTDVATKEVQDTIAEPLEAIQKPIKDITDPLNGIQQNLNKSVSEVTKSIDSIGRKKAADKKAALEKIAKLPISSVASKNVVKVQRGTWIERIVSIMHRKNIHTIPVYDGERLVGVIGRHDILNAAFYSQRV